MRIMSRRGGWNQGTHTHTHTRMGMGTGTGTGTGMGMGMGMLVVNVQGMCSWDLLGSQSW